MLYIGKSKMMEREWLRFVFGYVYNAVTLGALCKRLVAKGCAEFLMELCRSGK